MLPGAATKPRGAARDEFCGLGPLGSTEKQSVFNKLQDSCRSIAMHNAPQFSYLSVIRNEIQYRHGGDVWLPNVVKRDTRTQLGRLLKQWKCDPMDVDLAATHSGKLGQFATACVFIISLYRALLMQLAERSSNKGRSFATSGPLVYV